MSIDRRSFAIANHFPWAQGYSFGDPVRAAILATASAQTLAYILAVEAADGEELENAVLLAMVDFANYRIPLGGACCLMAGARTLAGALVPMVGAAPTAFNFVSGDYNRKTGLKGDGSTKYLDSNRNNNADPQDNNHQSVFVSTAQSASVVTAYIGAGVGGNAGATHIGVNQINNDLFFRSRSISVGLFSLSATSTGLIGMSRESSLNFSYRAAGASAVAAVTSQIPFDGSVVIFNRVTTTGFTDARLSYYSIGTNVDLVAMDTAITTCMNALAVAGI